MGDDFSPSFRQRKPFTLVGFTTAEAWSDYKEEGAAVTDYLSVFDYFHIRKKEASKEYTLKLIGAIPTVLHPRLILHSHYDLASEFELGGVHRVNTMSFHSLFEIEKFRSSFGCNITESFRYAFLSPLFDSISKKGYLSRFDTDDPALRNAVLNLPVIGLGGVTPHLFMKLFTAKFAGAALLGYLWSPKTTFESRVYSISKAKEIILQSN